MSLTIKNEAACDVKACDLCLLNSHLARHYGILSCLLWTFLRNRLNSGKALLFMAGAESVTLWMDQERAVS